MSDSDEVDELIPGDEQESGEEEAEDYEDSDYGMGERTEKGAKQHGLDTWNYFKVVLAANNAVLPTMGGLEVKETFKKMWQEDPDQAFQYAMMLGDLRKGGAGIANMNMWFLCMEKIWEWSPATIIAHIGDIMDMTSCKWGLTLLKHLSNPEADNSNNYWGNLALADAHTVKRVSFRPKWMLEVMQKSRSMPKRYWENKTGDVVMEDVQKAVDEKAARRLKWFDARERTLANFFEQYKDQLPDVERVEDLLENVTSVPKMYDDKRTMLVPKSALVMEKLQEWFLDKYKTEYKENEVQAMVNVVRSYDFEQDIDLILNIQKDDMADIAFAVTGMPRYPEQKKLYVGEPARPEDYTLNASSWNNTSLEKEAKRIGIDVDPIKEANADYSRLTKALTVEILQKKLRDLGVIEIPEVKSLLEPTLQMEYLKTCQEELIGDERTKWKILSKVGEVFDDVMERRSDAYAQRKNNDAKCILEKYERAALARLDEMLETDDTDFSIKAPGAMNLSESMTDLRRRISAALGQTISLRMLFKADKSDKQKTALRRDLQAMVHSIRTGGKLQGDQSTNLDRVMDVIKVIKQSRKDSLKRTPPLGIASMFLTSDVAKVGEPSDVWGRECCYDDYDDDGNSNDYGGGGEEEQLPVAKQQRKRKDPANPKHHPKTPMYNQQKSKIVRNTKRMEAYKASDRVNHPLNAIKKIFFQELTKDEQKHLAGIVPGVIPTDREEKFIDLEVTIDHLFEREEVVVGRKPAKTDTGMYRFAAKRMKDDPPIYRELFREFVLDRDNKLALESAAVRKARIAHERIARGDRDKLGGKPVQNLIDLTVAVVNKFATDLRNGDDTKATFAYKYAPRIGGSADKATGVGEGNKGVGELLAIRLGYLNGDGPSWNTSGVLRTLEEGPLRQVKRYHKFLADGRLKYKISETFIGRGRLQDIDYDALPAANRRFWASRIYRRHDSERYQKHIDAVNESLGKGGRGINTTHQSPHLAVEKLIELAGRKRLSEDERLECADLETFLMSSVEKLGKKVPKNCDIMAMVDVSGSMYGEPVNAAVTLGTIMAYAQSKKSPFFRRVITFDTDPKMYDLAPIYDNDVGCLGEDDNQGKQKIGTVVKDMLEMSWGGSTNFHEAMKKMLEFSVKNPESGNNRHRILMVFTDMQFDSANHGYGSFKSTPLQESLNMFVEAGIEPPIVVFWNLRGDIGPGGAAQPDQPNTIMLSGFNTESIGAFFDMVKEREFKPVSLPATEEEPFDPRAGPVTSDAVIQKLLKDERYRRLRVVKQ